MSAGSYNEVVLDAKSFESMLPESMEAIYYHKGRTGADAIARDMQRVFVQRYHEQLAAAGARAPPVLSFDGANWDAPFADEGAV